MSRLYENSNTIFSPAATFTMGVALGVGVTVAYYQYYPPQPEVKEDTVMDMLYEQLTKLRDVYTTALAAKTLTTALELIKNYKCKCT